jgi:uncharacterized protein
VETPSLTLSGGLSYRGFLEALGISVDTGREPIDVHVAVDVPVPMRDGAVLRANVYRPSAGGPFPVLLTRLPYGKDVYGSGGLAPDPLQAVRRGYVVVVQDTRGRFASAGEFRPWCEAEDGFDSVGWAAALPFSDGRVGMFGASYVGFTQWAAAAEGPPALKAIAPCVTCADPLNGLFFRGGAFQLGMNAVWYLSVIGPEVLTRHYQADPEAAVRALADLAEEIDGMGVGGFASLPLSEFEPVRRHQVGQGFFEPVRNPMDSAAFDYMSIARKHERIDVPSFNIGGWYDIFLGQTIDNYVAMRARGVPTRLLIGPWIHDLAMNPVGEMNFGFASRASGVDLQADLASMQLDWFDRFVRRRGGLAVEESPVKIFVMGTNRWRDEDDWPLARAREMRYHLHPEGLLSPTPPPESEPDSYLYDPADPVLTCGGATFLSPEFPPGARDQRDTESRADVLTYTTPQLQGDVEVTGPVVARLWATSSARDTDFVVRLCDVFPNGRSVQLTDGIIRARYREFHNGAAPSLIQPGRAYEYVVDLWATSNVFKAGHRIRLQVTSSSFPRWDRNPNTGRDPFVDSELMVAKQRILHDPRHPSCVLLQVVPPAETPSLLSPHREGNLLSSPRPSGAA